MDALGIYNSSDSAKHSGDFNRVKEYIDNGQVHHVVFQIKMVEIGEMMKLFSQFRPWSWLIDSHKPGNKHCVCYAAVWF